MGRQAPQWGHAHPEYHVLSPTLHFTLVLVSYEECLLTLPWNRTFSLSVCFHFKFFFFSHRPLWLTAVWVVYFQDLDLRPPALLKSVCCIFAQIVRPGWGCGWVGGYQISVGSGARQYIPLCYRPLRAANRPLPHQFLLFCFAFFSPQERHMSWWYFNHWLRDQLSGVGEGRCPRAALFSSSVHFSTSGSNQRRIMKKAGTDNLDK